MNLLQQVTSGRSPAPRRVMLYGTHGVGKSTWASCAPNPIFIQCEDGLGELDCAKFPLATTFDQAMQALSELYTDEHPYRTVVVDSVDWLERLIWADVCRKRNVQSIEEIGYAKGYVFAMTQWREFMDGLSALRTDKGMTTVLIAHARIERFENPETDSYDPLRAATAPPGVAGPAGVVRRGSLCHVPDFHEANRRRSSTRKPEPGHPALASASCVRSSALPTWPRTA